METTCREHPLVVLPALPVLHPEQRGGDAGGKLHPPPDRLLGRCRGSQMVSGIPLSLRLPGGHLPEPAAHGKTALEGGAAQREILFCFTFYPSDERVQGAFLFEGGEGGVGAILLTFIFLESNHATVLSSGSRKSMMNSV
jgi:hypothetical protein